MQCLSSFCRFAPWVATCCLVGGNSLLGGWHLVEKGDLFEGIGGLALAVGGCGEGKGRMR
jgi:hypothetical protein